MHNSVLGVCRVDPLGANLLDPESSHLNCLLVSDGDARLFGNYFLEIVLI